MRSRRKAISGAITALILVIASVVIAIAVVGLAFGLFSGFAGSGTGLQQVGTGTLIYVRGSASNNNNYYTVIQVTIKNGGSSAVAFPSTINFGNQTYSLSQPQSSSQSPPSQNYYAVYTSNPFSGSTTPTFNTNANQVSTVQPNSAQTYYIVFPVNNFNPEAYSSPSTFDLNFPNGVTLAITYVYPNQ